MPPLAENGVPRPERPPPLRLGEPLPDTFALIGTVSLKLSGSVEMSSSASSTMLSLMEEQIEAPPITIHFQSYIQLLTFFFVVYVTCGICISMVRDYTFRCLKTSLLFSQAVRRCMLSIRNRLN